MKRIRKLDGPTKGLADYLACNENMANWEEFRSHRAGRSRRELVEALVICQHGLCGYCEREIPEGDRQVEHVIPRSDPRNGTLLALDVSNLIACCRGGDLSNEDPERFLPPLRENLSCGQAKGNNSDPDFVDPRQLPASPSVMRVNDSGRIEADFEACVEAGIPIDRVNKTIEILGLNVERLRLARENFWKKLSENWEDHFDDPEVMARAAKTELLPRNGHLSKFFTTSRSYFFPICEGILARTPDDWV